MGSDQWTGDTLCFFNGHHRYDYGCVALLEIEKPTLGKLIERLEAKGWVERRADENDARSKRLFLTPAARPLLEEMAQQADEVIAGVFAGIGREDSERLRGTLSRIKDNLSGMLGEQTGMQAEVER